MKLSFSLQSKKTRNKPRHEKATEGGECAGQGGETCIDSSKEVTCNDGRGQRRQDSDGEGGGLNSGHVRSGRNILRLVRFRD